MELDFNDKLLLTRGIQQLETANGILRFLTDYFRDKYGLTPDNQVTPDGRIISVSTLQTKEKLNGTPINTGVSTESDGTPPNVSTVLGL